MSRITSGILKTKKRVYINEYWLFYQYIVLKKAPPLIAKENGIGSNTIRRGLDRHKIPKRDHSESQKLNKNNSGQFKKGHKGWNKGIPRKESVKMKIGQTQIGEKNHQWKGDNVGYNCLHKWVYRHKKRLYFCFICNQKKVFTNFANTNNQYKRDLKDYIEVCVSCHRLLEKCLKRRGLSPELHLR